MTEEQPAEEHLTNPQDTSNLTMTLPTPISQDDDTVEKIKTKKQVSQAKLDQLKKARE